MPKKRETGDETGRYDVPDLAQSLTRQALVHLQGGDVAGAADDLTELQRLLEAMSPSAGGKGRSVSPRSAVTVQAFGTFLVKRADGSNLFGRLQSPLPRCLLAALLANPEGLTAPALLRMLYDGGTDRKRALQILIYRLRESLQGGRSDVDDAGVIQFHDGRYRLTPGRLLHSDVAVFRQAFHDWAHAESVEDRTAACQTIIEVYRGPLFQGLPDAAWIVDAREAVRTQWLSAVEWYVHQLVAHHASDRARHLVERCTVIDPAAAWTILRHALPTGPLP